ncbi:MAG: hypothetical protein C4527_04805 [Candidatus Omnitrophota bacterium]|jgi:hypothetical protein|nr:MAG: hypothetical protein C4527_04805 [Candidatus Omnitrophota bacterium]
MIHSGFNELKKAYRLHRDASLETKGISSCLLLFYAVECGLKSLYLRRNNFRTTKQIIKNHGHDLNQWIKVLRLPAYLCGRHSFCLERDRNKKGGVKKESIQNAHQAWRYGVTMESGDEIKILQWLKSISQWISEESVK